MYGWEEVTQQFKVLPGTNTCVMGYLKPFNPQAVDDRSERVGSCEIRRTGDELTTRHQCEHHGEVEVFGMLEEMGALAQRALTKRRDLNGRLLMLSFETIWGEYSEWPRVYPWWMRLLRRIFKSCGTPLTLRFTSLLPSHLWVRLGCW